MNTGNGTDWSPIRSVIIRVIRELTQQDGYNTQDGRMTKKCDARLCIPKLTPYFCVILPSWVFQPSCCVSSLLTKSDDRVAEVRFV